MKAIFFNERFKTFIILLSLLTLLFPAQSTYGSEDDLLPIVPPDKFPEAFLKEKFHYDISFLWFSEAAEAHFFFENGEKPSEYRAVLDAETKGFIGWMSSYRKQRYVSVMELVEIKGKRTLRSRYFSQEIISGGKKSVTEFILDYSKKIIETRESVTGSEPMVSTSSIPSNVIYNDILSAYYNLRGGVFGVKKKGDKFKIDTVPRKGVSHITVTIADKEIEKNKYMEDADFLVRLDVDKRIFGQREGLVWVWADDDFVPLKGEVKNVSFFGDVRGRRRDQAPSKGSFQRPTDSFNSEPISSFSKSTSSSK